MRYEGIHITTWGVKLGQEVRSPWMVRRGALAVADARRTRQRSAYVASVSGPELAVQAGRVVLRRREVATGKPAPIGVHVHASTYDKPDFWSAACFVLDQLPVAECAMALDVNAMSNSMALGVDMAAGLLCGRPDLEAALITAGDRFDGPRFGSRYGRYSTDFGMLYRDAGAGVVVSRTPGVAELMSAVTRTDLYLKGRTRGTTASTDDLMARYTVDPRARTGAWVRTHGGLEEAFRRNSTSVIETVMAALADAGIELDQVRRIIVPFLGHEAVVSQWLRPLGNVRRPDADASGTANGASRSCRPHVGVHHLLGTNALSPGDYVVSASAGAGDELDHDCLAHG